VNLAAQGPSSSPLVPGYRLDRYELLCPIAEGGMASVWVARLQRKHGFEKLVAIKTILPKFAEDIRFQQMFLDEARIASRIEHANVAHILDLGDEHDVLYLVMEWVDGEALSKLNRMVEKKGQKIPPGVLLRVIADTCGGLHAAHELRGTDGELLGVVHRDVSPQNVLINSKGVAKLIDFGIAKARDRVAEDTNAGLLKGKIQYMSPEQALGKSVDRRADVWAVGAIVYHLLAGHPPYEGENQLATLHLLTSGKPPIPLPPTVPAPVSAVVRKALSQDPERRFQSAAELQSALETAMAEGGLVTTTADVAAYVAEHMGDRADARRQSIDLALKAATERVRMQALLQPPSSESASGVLDARTTVRGGSSGHIAAASVRPSVPPGAVNAQGTHDSFPPSSAAPAAMAKPLSEVSNATLGSAALTAPLSMPPPAPRRSRGPLVAIALAALVGAGVAGAVALRLVGSDGARSTAGANAATAATATAAAPPGAAATGNATSASNAPPAPASSSAPATAAAAPTDTAAQAATALPRYGGWAPAPRTGGAAAAPPAAAPTVASTAASPPAATTAAPAPKPPPKPGVVDDGF
jgi:serine/threonine-protein kinase